MYTLIYFSATLALLSSLLYSVEAFVPNEVGRRAIDGRSLLFAAADTTTTTSTVKDLLSEMEDCKRILYKAAETKQEDADAVIDALLKLEKLAKKVNKADPSLARTTQQALSKGGVSWRLIFTTGTVDTQRKLGGTKINYFPLKATQSFDSSSEEESNWTISNGIGVGDFDLIEFSGDFDWTLTESSGLTKLTFDFDRIALFNGLLDIPLKNGQAASIGAKSGLGSEKNVALNKKGKRAYFNWISADDQIATARGGGGGLALWKRL
mmetsp:Transcript_4463/g.4940  ORF Transcript_4463/g.4940 Transcript_4463/m.4940 type:complete len:266 (-) Transcript_4463:346-1143(-)